METTTAARAVQPSIGAPAAPSFDHERALFELRNVVNGIDAMSQEAFTSIATLARLALLAMERPVIHPQERALLANALQAISSQAESAQDRINAEAEDVGCAYVDEAEQRRWAAARS